MRFRQVRLQLQSAFGQSARFFAAFLSWIEGVKYPTFQLRVARKRERKFRIELDCARIKLLALFEFPEVLNGVLEIMRLDKSEIGFAILGGLAFDLRPFTRRKSCLQRFRDFLREIGLNCEN